MEYERVIKYQHVIFKIRRKITSQKPWDPVVISDNLTWSEFSRINLFLHELQGAEPIVSVARLYTEPSSAHVIGYVSKASKKDLQLKEYLKNKISKSKSRNKLVLALLINFAVPIPAISESYIPNIKDCSLVKEKQVYDYYERQEAFDFGKKIQTLITKKDIQGIYKNVLIDELQNGPRREFIKNKSCLLYTSPSPRDATLSRMPSSA